MACSPRRAHPDDFSWVIYRLRKEARWHDGKPVTPEDVIFSIEALKKHSPMYASYYGTSSRPRRSASATSSSPSTRPATANCRMIVGELTVLPKHWWEGTDSQGRKRDISATTLEKPLGSGALPRSRSSSPGRRSVLERVKDYWGKNLPTADRPEQFRRNALSSSSATTWWRWKPSRPIRRDWIAENSAKQWATAYDFPAVREKRVIKEEFPINSSGRMQGFAFNLRRDAVQGCAAAACLQLRLRFRGNEQAAVLRPVQAHQQLFRGYRTCLVRTSRRARNCRFSKPCATRCRPRSSPRPISNPVGGNPEAVRNNLREATRLLKEAGFEMRDRKLVDPAGKPVSDRDI